MSKIYSNKVKTIVTAEVRECIAIKCNVCGKIIHCDSSGYKTNDRTYYEVTTSHSDWGNDSCESIKNFDICPDCVVGFVDRYLKEAKEDDVSTAHIEIQKAEAYIHDVRI